MDIATTCMNCYEKSLQFFQGICAATVQWTNSFLWFLVVEIKNLQRSEQVIFWSCGFAAQFCSRSYAVHTCAPT